MLIIKYITRTNCNFDKQFEFFDDSAYVDRESTGWNFKSEKIQFFSELKFHSHAFEYKIHNTLISDTKKHATCTQLLQFMQS